MREKRDILSVWDLSELDDGDQARTELLIYMRDKLSHHSR
jgi:hypothetical protein